ncbi:MAG TPA: hypothetical protein VG964_04215 [Candidatus Saccharimonadales bacterium]|nr:hypothetical protein [Candidatus Saccharimonadales bacterium]
MKDRHVTSPLNQHPFRQYRVAELEEDDIPAVAGELHRVFGLDPDVLPDPKPHVELLRSGGKIAVAARLIAVEAPHGPDDLEVEAAATLSDTSKTPSVYMRDNQTPTEVVLYLHDYVKGHEPSGLQRMPRARDLLDL